VRQQGYRFSLDTIPDSSSAAPAVATSPSNAV